MQQKAFSAELKKFCLDHAMPAPGAVTRYSAPLAKSSPGFPVALRSVERALFEQLLLFDTVQLSVNGANIIAPLLCNRMGTRVFEDLLEQDAITFVQWDTEVLFSSSDNAHVNAFFTGRIDDGGPIDVEKRIDHGFLLEHVGTPARRKVLKSKLIRQTSILEDRFNKESLELALQALADGSFAHLGLSARPTIQGSPLADGRILGSATDSLLAYRHLLANNMVSVSDQGIFDLFSNGIVSLERADLRLRQFGVLAEHNQFPDLRELFDSINDPFQHAATFRKSSVAKNFRAWLSKMETTRPEDMVREYVNAFTAKKGFFETAPRRFLKSIAMAAIGSATHAGATALGANGLAADLAYLTGLAAPTVEAIQNKAMNSGLGVIGNLIADNVMVDWTPKAYFDGLRRLKDKAQK